MIGINFIHLIRRNLNIYNHNFSRINYNVHGVLFLMKESLNKFMQLYYNLCLYNYLFSRH